MLEVWGLTKAFQEHVVLDDLQVSVSKGDVVAVIGASGAGKTTFLRCLNLLEKPDNGNIRIGDLSVSVANSSKAAIYKLRQRTAMVFQQFNLFTRKTALENVTEGLVIVKKIDWPTAREIAVRHLDKVGIRGKKQNHYPHQLSGGQQQRVGIARALAMNPAVLLVDEPTSALDPESIAEVLETLRNAAMDGNTMLIVSHEMEFVRKVANRVLFLEGGRILFDGSTQEMFEQQPHPRIREFLSN